MNSPKIGDEVVIINSGSDMYRRTGRLVGIRPTLLPCEVVLDGEGLRQPIPFMWEELSLRDSPVDLFPEQANP